MTATIARRTLSARAGSPRACSSMTRSSMLATKVTPAALIACKSHGARSQGCEDARRPSAELASASARLATRGSLPGFRIVWAGSRRFMSALEVGAMLERSTRSSPRTATSTAPSTAGTQARPTSNARSASSGSVAAEVRRVSMTEG
jgi:hypothetical protein